MTDRGQTQQDFAVGISVFLLAVFFVFAFVPTTIAPTDANTESESYVADRVGSSVVENVTTPAEAGRLDVDAAETFFSTHGSGAAVRANYSVAETTAVNVTLETLSGVTVAVDANATPPAAGPGVGGTLARAGDHYPGGVGVSATRVVRLDDRRYRLVVRVW
ncbi:MAG: hypothetical protein V5A31_01990 [Haloferacaceae archaeon]